MSKKIAKNQKKKSAKKVVDDPAADAQKDDPPSKFEYLSFDAISSACYTSAGLMGSAWASVGAAMWSANSSSNIADADRTGPSGIASGDPSDGSSSLRSTGTDGKDYKHDLNDYDAVRSPVGDAIRQTLMQVVNEQAVNEVDAAKISITESSTQNEGHELAV
jgi:hypothetical protein